ncbi:unnamed protein product [Paramecium primaurelia]|uniref:Protein kinase domain-containing protein n=1 Tax=Paramecium primaurelia TaxID=5886 RepID=A0A8S1NV12_PARPR|nr:unnamed protein product [Paramecium primaurelia]
MNILQEYQLQECLGNGSYGIVHSGVNVESGKRVAIKMLRETFESMEECLQLREVKALMKLKEHPNIIKLLDMRYENKRLYLIYEYVENNVYQLYTQDKLDEERIKHIILQCANALLHIHHLGYFHRDLKPENILIQNDCVKLIDFGLSREVKPPFTDYVSTRWYRAPEILLHSTSYDAQIDIFALGCVTCELFLGRPLFVGASELEQFDRMLQILGTFNNQDWSEGVKLVNQLGLKLTHYPQKLLHVIKASPMALDLIQGMLKWNPKQRFTAKQITEHLLFKQQQTTPEFAPRKLQDLGQQQQELKKFTNQKQQYQSKK